MQANRYDTIGIAGQKLVAHYWRDEDANGATTNDQTDGHIIISGESAVKLIFTITIYFLKELILKK